MCGPQNEIQRHKKCQRAAIKKISRLFSNLNTFLMPMGSHFKDNLIIL